MHAYGTLKKGTFQSNYISQTKMINSFSKMPRILCIILNSDVRQLLQVSDGGGQVE